MGAGMQSASTLPAPAPTPAPAPSRALPFTALIIGSACLAFGPLLVRLSDVSPVSAAFWRLGLATPLLLLATFAFGSRQALPSLRTIPWGLAALAGLFFGADLPAWHFGILQTTTANATLFGNGAAFLLAGWAMIWGGEPADRQNLASLALALVGTLLLLGASAEIGTAHLVGDLLCLLGTSLYTGYLIILMRLRSRFATGTILTIATAVAAVVVLPFALLAPGSFWPTDWSPVLTYAVTSQFIGQGLVIFATGSLPAAVVGVGLLVQPILSAASGWLIFGETFNLTQGTGAAIICLALVLVRR